MTVYSQYFRVRTRYYNYLHSFLSENRSDFPPSLRIKACEQAISLISLLSTDELHKLQGIYLSPSDNLCESVVNFFETVEKPTNPLKILANSLFSAAFHHERLFLSSFGPRILKTFVQMRENQWLEPVVSLLKSLKSREFAPKNREGLIFWKCVQDFLFEICGDNRLSNTEQLEFGHIFCKLVIKAYFLAGSSEKAEKFEQNPAFLKKYLLFLADSAVRAFEKESNLLVFELFAALLHKPALEAENIEKLLKFVRGEAERRAEKLEGMGKKLEKMENYRSVQGFIGSLEKMREKKKKIQKKSKENMKEIGEESERKRRDEREIEGNEEEEKSKGKRKMF